MITSTSKRFLAEGKAADVLIPVIRTAATISFAIAPYSLGFVIIAVSEQLIRMIMVGEDPETLVSVLQRQFPNEPIAVMEDDDRGLVRKVVNLIDSSMPMIDRPLTMNSVIDALCGCGEETT